MQNIWNIMDMYFTNPKTDPHLENIYEWTKSAYVKLVY